MEIELLEEIGLTKSEIKVYYALLEIGSSSTGKIVDSSGVASSKIYELLEKLMQKGLVSFVIKSGTKYYEAAPPQRIMDYVAEKEQKILSQKEKLNSLLPELELKRSMSKDKSETQIFKGIKGAKTAFDDVLFSLNKNDELLVLGFSDVDENFQKFLVRFHLRRSEKGIKLRAIFGDDLKEMGSKISKLKNSEVKFSSSSEQRPVAIILYADKTLFSMPKDDLWIQIKNQRLVESFKTYFEAEWTRDAKVFSGFDIVTKKFDDMLAEHKEGEEYYVLGASLNLRDQKMRDWLLDFHKRRLSQKTKVKFLTSYDAHDQIFKNAKNAGDPNLELSKIKRLSPEFSTPFQINIFKGDRVWFIMWEKEMKCFEIKSKEIYANMKTYFDALWNQKTKVYNGLDEIKSLIKESLDFGDYDVFAEGMKIVDVLGQDFFLWWQNEKKKRGIKSRGIMGDSYKNTLTVTKATTNFKYVHGYENPGLTFIFKDKIANIMLTKNPTAFLIENKEVADSNKTYFEQLWNREAYIVKGLNAIRDLFEEMLESGHCDFIGARGYFMDHRPEYIKKWSERAKKTGFTMRNIVDPEIKGHVITTFPFCKTKYTLSKEFAEMSVFWIFGNKVAISNWVGDEPIATIIENKQFYDMYKKQFESLWNK